MMLAVKMKHGMHFCGCGGKNAYLLHLGGSPRVRFCKRHIDLALELLDALIKHPLYNIRRRKKGVIARVCRKQERVND